MKKSKLFVILILISGMAISQTTNSFKEIVDKTNVYLSSYERINPYLDHYEVFLIKNTCIPKHLTEEKYSGIDSISKEDLIEEYQSLISDHIRALFTHKDFQNYDIEEMLKSDLLYIQKSEDHKLYNITFEAKTGGTYRRMISLMFYFEEQETNENGEKISIAKECLQDDIFEEDGFVDIELIETKEGVKYILSCGVITSTISSFESIMSIKYADGIFVRDFYYTIHTYGLGGNLNYDSDSKTIRVDYINDYLNEDCNCQNIEDIKNDQKDDPVYENKVFEKQRCYCLFEFDGNNFVLKEQSQETVEE